MPYKLPEEIPEGFRCVVVYVPDCLEALLALKGSYNYLCNWVAWERTDDRTRARDMASAFKNADAFSFVEECGDVAGCPCDDIRLIIKEELANIMITINNYAGGGGCGCGCAGSGGGTGGTGEQPTIFNPPTTSTNQVGGYDCAFAHYEADKFERFLEVLRVVVPFAGALFSVAALITAWLTAGTIVLTWALATEISAWVGTGVLGAIDVSTFISWWQAVRSDFICYVSQHMGGSSAGAMQASLEWLASQGGDENQNIKLAKLYFRVAMPYQDLYTTAWREQYDDAECCGGGGGDDDFPTFGVYSLVPVTTVQLNSETEGGEFGEVFGAGHILQMTAVLEAGQSYTAELLADTSGVTDPVVGFAVKCLFLNKTGNNPTFTYVQGTPTEVVPFGVVFPGGGFCAILDTESGTDLDGFIAAMEDDGFAVEQNLSSAVLTSDILTIPGYTFRVHDREGVGGSGMVIDARYGLYVITKA